MKRSLVLVALAAVGVANAQVIIYDNLATTATAGYSELISNDPVFGDSLTLLQPGPLTFLGASIFNSTSGGNTGSMLTTSLTFNFYDNTSPYGGGTLSQPLVGQAAIAIDLTNGGTNPEGLPAGFFTTFIVDVSSLNITVPQNVLVTQHFDTVTGTTNRVGLILFSDPGAGSSPNTVYLKSGATSEGLYTFSGNPGQFGFHLESVPEPASLAVLGIAALTLIRRRRR